MSDLKLVLRSQYDPENPFMVAIEEKEKKKREMNKGKNNFNYWYSE